MKQGRTVWYITGNLSSDQATSLVEDANQKLALKPMEINDIPD